jgi:hypothetical protein
VHPAEDPHSLGSLLLAARLVTPSQLSEAVQVAKIMRVRLGEVFTRFARQNPHLPEIDENRIEALLARQDHARSGISARAKADAAIRALDAASAAHEAHSRAIAEGSEVARKITVNDFDEGNR